MADEKKDEKKGWSLSWQDVGVSAGVGLATTAAYDGGKYLIKKALNSGAQEGTRQAGALARGLRKFLL